MLSDQLCVRVASGSKQVKSQLSKVSTNYLDNLFPYSSLLAAFFPSLLSASTLSFLGNFMHSRALSLTPRRRLSPGVSGC